MLNDIVNPFVILVDFMEIVTRYMCAFCKQGCRRVLSIVGSYGLRRKDSLSSPLSPRIFLSSLSWTGFVRNKSIPTANASCCASEEASPVRAISVHGAVPFSFSMARMCLAAWNPSITGMEISRRRHLRCPTCLQYLSTAIWPLVAVSYFNPSFFMNETRILRFTGLSSTSRKSGSGFDFASLSDAAG